MNQKPHVALISETTVGGVRRHIVTIAKNLDPERFNVTVMISPGRKEHQQESDLVAELQQNQIAYEIVPMLRSISPRHDMQTFHRLRELLGSGRFDVVHAHGSKAGFVARKICTEYSIPCFYSPHVFAFMRADGFSKKLYLWGEKVASRWKSSLVVNASWEKECALAHGLASEGIYVVPNAIDRPVSVHRNFRNEVGTRKDTVVFLTIGRLVRYKGQRILLDAFTQIADMNAELWLLGEGEDRAVLMRLAESNGIARRVRFLGYRKNINDIIAASDCFVLPSRIEGCPYTLLEALALEKSVIATNVRGTSEILQHVRGAYLVEWNDSAQLSDRMRSFAQSPHTGTPIHELPGAWFDVPRQIRALEEIYTGKFIESIRY